jgi:hypothetical protein
MRTILFAITLLIFTASAHAAVPASNAVDCNPNGTQIDGHKVVAVCAPGTHTIISETWHNKDDKPDRADGPASIMRDAKTGTVVFEAWLKDGKRDRADGPARIHRDARTGIVTYEEWYKDGKRHRVDAPAVIERDAATGKVTREKWYRDGQQIGPPSAAAAK